MGDRVTINKFYSDKWRGNIMKQKLRLGIEILLVVAAIIVAIYNFSMERQATYFASIVAVSGTIAFLVRDMYKSKKK